MSVADVEKAVSALSEGLVADPGDLAGLVEARQALDRARQMISTIIASLDADILTLMDRERIRDTVVAGIRVAVKAGGWVGWDNDGLRHAVLTRARDMALAVDRGNTAVDPDTGERVPTWEQAVRAIADVWPLAGYQARAGALRALQVDPGEFATRGPDRLVVGDSR